jgi:hypothetical protein
MTFWIGWAHLASLFFTSKMTASKKWEISHLVYDLLS